MSVPAAAIADAYDRLAQPAPGRARRRPFSTWQTR
jgi:hypothetical protein